jgi:RNA polymerase sigma-70 factor (ECF subfamily)
LAGYVYRRTGDEHATDDIVSEVFLAALRHLPGYRHRGVPIRYWLYRIATNVVNRWVRRRRSGLTVDMAVDPDERAVAGDNGEPVAIREFAQQALLKLSPKHQAVLSLHYLEGLSVQEVAAVVGCRVGTVKSRLSRARDALRRRLEGGR